MKNSGRAKLYSNPWRLHPSLCGQWSCSKRGRGTCLLPLKTHRAPSNTTWAIWRRRISRWRNCWRTIVVLLKVIVWCKTFPRLSWTCTRTLKEQRTHWKDALLAFYLNTALNERWRCWTPSFSTTVRAWGGDSELREGPTQRRKFWSRSGKRPDMDQIMGFFWAPGTAVAQGTDQADPWSGWASVSRSLQWVYTHSRSLQRVSVAGAPGSAFFTAP